MLILASASPRRRELLAAAGYDCVVDAVDVDETPRAGEAPRAYVERLAREKAAAGALRHPRAFVLGADTAVVIDGLVLGKPRHVQDAARMLRLLAGRVHEVLTGVAVVAPGGMTEAGVDRTAVTFEPLSAAEIDAYVATGEPMDKAGAYAIQGHASRFIPTIDGSHANVVGLPVALVAKLLEKTGWTRPPAPQPGS